jgi:hypothetical protein
MNDPLAYDPEDAYYGPLGEFAKRHRNQITLNLAAFYAMLLPAIGSLIGRRAVITVSRDRHYPNLFSAIVGSTGSGKGNCWNIVEYLLEKIDPTSPARLRRDAASAQGLIGLVRDASTRTEGKRTIEDPGVTDKRCLLLFEEMDTLFVAMSRTGSTLAPVWNMAYDGKTLENNTRLLRERATNPHISAVCHITEESFQQAVQQVSKGLGCSNGFYNRFITAHAVGERRLSRGGEMPDVDDLVERIRDVLAALGPDNANEAVPITWHPSTHKAWDGFDDALASAHPFLSGLGGLAARLRPNTMRVAMIFAIMDGDREIMPCHLKAAKSFCLQCIDNSRSLFVKGGQCHRSRSLHDRVLSAIQAGNHTRTTLSDALGRKGFTGEQLAQVLIDLLAEGRITKGETLTMKGKAVDAWFSAETVLAADALKFEERDCQTDTDGRPSLQGDYRELLADGAKVVITEDTEALDLNGSSVHLASGQMAALAHLTQAATDEERAFFDRLVSDHPYHCYVLVSERPLILDSRVMRLAARVALA